MKVSKIIAFLVCPLCHEKALKLLSSNKIVCGRCQGVYRVLRGIPILLPQKLSSQELNQQAWFNQHYSKFPNRYRLENWRLSMLKRVFETGFNHKVKNYLDIGCGATGYTVIEAAKRYGWNTFGVDISLEAMLKAKKLAEKRGVGEKTAFIVCSAEDLPFTRGQFDYVSALGVMEHLENDEKVIASVANIVKRAGHFYICTPNTYRRMWPFLWPIYYYLDKNIGHKRHYGAEGLDQKLIKYGFKRTRVFYNGHLIKLIQFVLEKARLIDDKAWWVLEEKDINQKSMALQLNAFYQKIKK